MRSRNQKNFMWMPLSKNNRQSGIYRTVGLFSECFPLVSRRGIQRGGPQPSPLCRLWSGASRNAPVLFFRGGGPGSFQKRMQPLFTVPAFSSMSGCPPLQRAATDIPPRYGKRSAENTAGPGPPASGWY